MDLNILWFILIAVLLTGYSILDGFDLGAGILSLFAPTEEEKRIHMNAIGPVWDGNEVWLLTGGGALFAAFPQVYASVFSGFYVALMLLLLALILRAVSMEFRSKVESQGWRKAWDLAFGVGSFLIALLLGTALSNILRGIPIDDAGVFHGNLLTLLNPYGLVGGVFSVAVFTLHGATYMAMKGNEPIVARMKRLIPKLWIAVLFLFAAWLGWTFALTTTAGMTAKPLVWLFLGLTATGLALVPLRTQQDRPGFAFLASSMAIVGLMGIVAATLFPMLAPSSINQAFDLTIYNAASSHRTHLTMTVIAGIGVPLMLGYTILVYRIFKGKTVLDSQSY